MVQGFQKVHAGQQYDGFPAHTYNAMVDVINAYKRGLLTNTDNSVDTIRTAGVIHIRNDTGTLARHSVVGIGPPLVLPTADEAEWRDKVRMTGLSPTVTHVPDLFAVLREPIEAGQIGLATIAGVTQVSINVSDENHGFAGCEAANVSNLISRSSGGARILWKEDGVGVKRAVVRLGPPPEVGVVEIADGGSCVETERNGTTCLWSGWLLEIDTSGSTCSPWSQTDAIWVMETNVCDTQGANAFTKIRGGERYVAARMGKFTNAGDERDLYVIRNPDIGKVRVNKDDELDFLEDQYRDHVADGTYMDGDLLVKSETNDVLGDKLVRRFVDATGYNSNEQVLTHPAGSTTPTWVDVIEVEVVTDTQLYSGMLQKRTSTVKVLSEVDNGWSEAFPATEC